MYSELVFTISDPDNTPRLNHSFKMGLMLLHDFETGWYTMRSEEGDTNLIEPSKLPCEFYFQYQFQTNTSSRGFQGIASAELRFQERYRYPLPDSGSGFSPALNLYAGLRYSRPDSKNYFSKIGIAFRYYVGINPHGQFRALPYYQQWGLVLLLE
jgi:hypothetical protein